VNVGEALEGLTGTTAARLEALYAALLAGRLDEAAFLAAAEALVLGANGAAVALADASLTHAVGASTALGLTAPTADASRVREGLLTLVGDALGAETDEAYRFARYGKGEPAAKFQDAYLDGMKRRGIRGYRRVLSPGACELCQWLRKDGYVYPSEKSFHKHVGCTCYPEPVR